MLTYPSINTMTHGTSSKMPSKKTSSTPKSYKPPSSTSTTKKTSSFSSNKNEENFLKTSPSLKHHSASSSSKINSATPSLFSSSSTKIHLHPIAHPSTSLGPNTPYGQKQDASLISHPNTLTLPSTSKMLTNSNPSIPYTSSIQGLPSPSPATQVKPYAFSKNNSPTTTISMSPQNSPHSSSLKNNSMTQKKSPNTPSLYNPITRNSSKSSHSSQKIHPHHRFLNAFSQIFM